MRILGKKCKNLLVGSSAPEPPFASDEWGLRPQTSALLLPLAITTLIVPFLRRRHFISLKERKNIYSNVMLCFFRTFCI